VKIEELSKGRRNWKRLSCLIYHAFWWFLDV